MDALTHKQQLLLLKVELVLTAVDPLFPSELLEFFMAQIQQGTGNIHQRFWSKLTR